MQPEREYTKAKDYAFKLLSYRQRSSAELRRRLEKKGFTQPVIAETITYLGELNYINDAEFARVWIQERLRTRPQGKTLLRYQLRQKGVDKELIDAALQECAQTYDEGAAAKGLALSRRKKYRGLAPLKAKRRIYDYLRRRGFSSEAIMQALEE
ncbi:MAG: regulatory protein RecX [Candidatus Omnitrophota bacterium]